MDVDVQEDRFIVKTHTYTAHHTTNAQPCCTCFSPFLPPETNATAGFSTVYLVRDTRTRDQLALKRMLCQERESTEAAYREVQVLRAVRHRNVVSLLDQVPHSTPLHPTPPPHNFTSHHATLHQPAPPHNIILLIHACFFPDLESVYAPDIAELICIVLRFNFERDAR